MPHRRWRGVLDLLDEADVLLARLGQLVGEPIDPSLAQKIKTAAANARTVVLAARTAMERSAQITPT